jgi:putative membrane protein
MNGENARQGPVLIELEEAAPAAPQDAPPVPDADPATRPAPEGRAMQIAATLGARPPNRVARLFWGALGALIGLAASLAAWTFVTGLFAAQPILGAVAAGLLGLVVITLAILALREAAAFARLGTLDHLRRDAEAALAGSDLERARRIAAGLIRLYGARPELALGREALARRREEVFDAENLLSLTETELLLPLDRAAIAEVQAAARQVATVTALVPLALADVAAALTANLRMIRRIADIYGGRSGTLGAWRLTRAVMTHLVATGAVAIGDDLVGSALGGSVLSKVSRRFGEGVVNGALTARVGVAAMEVCRPLPFGPGHRPSVSKMVSRALTGLFGRSA